MSESRVRENRTHGSMRRREATTASRASTCRAAAQASRRPYSPVVADSHDLAVGATIGTVGGCRNIGAVRVGAETLVMALNFVGCDRGQLLLMPPSLMEWLPENHLVWTILGAVDAMDLARFEEAYRLGGAGRPAYDPSVMGCRCFCIRTRAGTGRRGGLSGRAGRMWRAR
jgi:hypothetical protein